MIEIGSTLKSAREKIGVSLEEVSQDLNIKELILENIEDGNIGCFKDIFVLKEYLQNYAKYLGLDPDKIINNFNEYLFEYTSKIPVEDIEKEIQNEMKNKEETNEIVSPYTKISNKPRSKKVKFIIIIGIIFIILIIFWSIKQIIINNGQSTTSIAYVN